jgi:copper chaperone CopZ
VQARSRFAARIGRFDAHNAETFMDFPRTNRIQIAVKLLLVAATISIHDGRLAAQQPVAIHVQITADDMCCQGCAQKVAAQLYAAPGVTTVAADVPNRTVKVTAKPSPKLTLERLWRAVEKGKGAPSKLITTQATYTFTKPEQLKPSERLARGQYIIELAQFPDAGQVQQIITLLEALPGVQAVTSDVSTRTLRIQTAIDKPLSEWALIRVAKQSGQSPLVIAGPHGLLTIEYAAPRPAHTPAYPS